MLQVHAGPQATTIFLDAPLSADGVSCKVSNQPAQVVGSGAVSAGDMTVKTTVLVDISTSIPTAMRGRVLDALDKLIEQKSANDQFKLVTFAQEETVLCDFTGDRYDLGKAAEGIVFNGQWSMIYDAIYNTVPAARTQEDSLTLYRTIVVTDGVDLTKIGVTMEELFLRLQDERYPVDVLAVSGSAQSTPNKELSGIARISGGRYCPLDPSTDLEGLGQALGVENCFYLQVQVPEQLLDGSVRQVDIAAGGESISLDVKFPAVYVQPEPTPEPSAEPEPTPTPAPEPAPTPPPAADPTFLEQYGTFLIPAAAAAAAVLAAAVVLALRGGRKNKPSASPEEAIPPAGPRKDIKPETIPFTGGAEYTVKLSAPRHPGREWVLSVTGEALIGRADHCDLQLEEGTVSREQCKLVAGEGGLEVVHLGSNRTLVNGVKVSQSCPLNSGDLLALGREQLRVDYIQRLDPSVDNGAEPQAGPRGKTTPLF